MRYAAITTVMVFLTVTVLIGFTEGAVKPTCVKNTKACVRSSECCGGCCHDEKCVDFSDSCVSDQLSGAGGPCALLDPPCVSGQKCVLQSVLCVQSPCPPVASCVPPDYQDYD